jgi:hypothetical protein
LPHFDSIYAVQSITFRLADSIPQERLLQLENALKQRPTSDQDRERRQKIEEWLDAGMGCLRSQASPCGNGDDGNVGKA